MDVFSFSTAWVIMGASSLILAGLKSVIKAILSLVRQVVKPELMKDAEQDVASRKNLIVVPLPRAELWDFLLFFALTPCFFSPLLPTCDMFVIRSCQREIVDAFFL